MQAIPVFADDDTKTKIDFDNNATCVISTESQIYYTEYSYDDIVVPVYMNLQGISGSNMYYSGYIYGSTTAFNFTDSNSNRYVISYFESANEYIRTTYYRTNQYYNIYLDNVVLSNNNTTLIGYLHLMGNEQNPTLTLNCANATQTMNVSAHNLYATGYEFGFVNSMVYALDNSANIDGMYDVLDHIENASLPEILTTIQTNHTALYNLINSVWLTDQSVLSVSQQTYNSVLSILNILNNIDDTLDTISWKPVTVTFDSSGTSFSSLGTDSTSANPLYLKLTSSNYNGLLHFRLNIRANQSYYRNYFNVSYIGRNTTENLVDELEIFVYTYNGSSIDIYVNNFNYGNMYMVLDNLYDGNINVLSYQVSLSEYISSTDIEYWQVLSALRNGKIARILSEQYASQVNQADAIKDEVDTNLQNLAQDIVVTKPSQVANIADDYIEQVDTIHNYQVFSWLSAPTFVLMMSIVAGLAVISYMLYGGQ